MKVIILIKNMFKIIKILNLSLFIYAPVESFLNDFHVIPE